MPSKSEVSSVLTFFYYLYKALQESELLYHLDQNENLLYLHIKKDKNICVLVILATSYPKRLQIVSVAEQVD